MEDPLSVAKNGKISVVIADDQLITRLGLKMVIERFADLCVLSDVEDGKMAVAESEKLKPAVVVMDVSMPVMDGVEATKLIKKIPGVNVLILTSHDHEDDVFAALAAGADGYCLKNAEPDLIATAIRTVAQGGTWLDPSIAKRVLKATVDRKAQRPSELSIVQKEKNNAKFALSTRETQVLELLVEGLTNVQMAKKLNLSADTIKTHMRHIMEKLSVSDRTQAAVKALREGLLDG